MECYHRYIFCTQQFNWKSYDGLSSYQSSRNIQEVTAPNWARLHENQTLPINQNLSTEIHYPPWEKGKNSHVLSVVFKNLVSCKPKFESGVEINRTQTEVSTKTLLIEPFLIEWNYSPVLYQIIIWMTNSSYARWKSQCHTIFWSEN